MSYFSRKLSLWQFPDDVKFGKKISERFDPEINSDVIYNNNNNQNIKIDYYRQASKEVTKDPRDFRSLPKPLKEFSSVSFSSNCPHWIRGEPARHIFIDQISAKQVRTDLNLYALLEDFFKLSENEILNINLLSPSNQSDQLCASVLFTSGYKAWELVREFKKKQSVSINNTFNWLMCMDSGAKEFERRRRIELFKEHKQTRYNNEKYESKESSFTTYNSHNSHNTHNNQNTYTSRHDRVTCSPFVPCLKIPFSCVSTFPFRLDENVLLSLFPASRFPSIFGVEEGGSSWHIHFGREIDVVEADRMFQRDVFVWNNHRFYFEKWRLVKGDKAWKIPDHYNEPKNLQIASDLILDLDDSNINNFNNNKNSNLLGADSIVDFSTLPKIHKKRRIESEEIVNIDSSNFEKQQNQILESSELELDHIVSSDNNVNINIKMKVKRKPIKKRTFIPIPLTPTTESTTNTNQEYDICDILSYPDTLNSGSARTEGHFRLTEEEKRKVKFPGTLEAFSYSSSTDGKNSLNSNSNYSEASNYVSVGRSSRAQNRRPLSTNNSITLDLFKVSPLQSTQKLVALRNSSIHSYGLILMEAADVGDLIIEYVGELVRASVANIRELLYEREYCGDGIASSYLFRLDDIMVIDASQRGNLARFINHSCDPNCVAKTITLNGSKRIVMYAKKGIRTGEEITYDYKFPIEKDPKKKVKCLCGSSSCRKYLN